MRSEFVRDRQRLGGLARNCLIGGILGIAHVRRKPLIGPAGLCRNTLIGNRFAVVGVRPKRSARVQHLGLNRRIRARIVCRRLDEDIRLCIQCRLGRNGRLDGVRRCQLLVVGALSRAVDDVTAGIGNAYAQALAVKLSAQGIVQNDRCARLTLDGNKRGIVRIALVADVGSKPLIGAARSAGALAGRSPNIRIERSIALDKSGEVRASPTRRRLAPSDADTIIRGKRSSGTRRGLGNTGLAGHRSRVAGLGGGVRRLARRGGRSRV